MINAEYQQLLAEKSFLNRDLADTPGVAMLTRRSLEARLRKVDAALVAMGTAAPAPACARLTFSGLPVVGSHGIFADFGMKAVNSFTEAVAAIAASLTAPLAPMGPIPNRDQNQLLITNTALGSFGFELEEYRPQQQTVATDSPVAIALERTRSLLQSTQGNDEELADVASETDQRALEKVRAFLKVLDENDAVCALQYGDAVVRFQDVGQIRQSLARLEADNLHERQELLSGFFEGSLPNARTFEFKLATDGQIVRGKIAPAVQNVDEINKHLQVRVQITVTITQVGKGRPRYVLTQLPQWPAALTMG
jgi:hypothetical protein